MFDLLWGGGGGGHVFPVRSSYTNGFSIHEQGVLK